MTRQTTIRSLLGPVEVAYVEEVRSDSGEVLEALGHFSCTKRRIQVKTGLHPTVEAHTLRHEWVHVIAFDSGLYNLMTDRTTEVLCDAVATALLPIAIPE